MILYTRGDFMKKIISLVLTFFMIMTSVCAFAKFDDIDQNTQSWAGEAISALSDKGIINGYGDGTFRPDGNVTRAEFAKMLTISFELHGISGSFDDIKGHWAEIYINSAAGVMYNPEKSFMPDNAATRADIAYAAANALELVSSDASIANSFSDFNLIEEDMKASVLAAIEKGIIIGYEDSTIRPQNPVTRAEAAVIIFRALNMKEPDKEEVPGGNEKPENPPEEDKPSADDKHIYGLYPGKNLILVKSVTSMLNEKGDESYRISYILADTGEEYSSVLPYDTKVSGVKGTLSALESGDVMIMDTAFHGYIDTLYVLASFKGDTPVFAQTLAGYRDYSFSYGKVTAYTSSNKAVTLSVDTGSEVKDEVVLKNTETVLYVQSGRANDWSYGSIGDLKPNTEDIYVFIRYTDGVSTEAIATIIE